MYPLTGTLLAAQQSASSVPYVKVDVAEKAAGVPHLRWTRLYSGSEADFCHAATMPGDGSLLRARVAPSDNTLYYQRVAAPGPDSNYGAWSSFGAVAAAGIALCSYGATVLLFYVGINQLTVYARESGDYGATFGDPVAVATAASAVGWLAADIKANGTVALFYSVGGTVYVVLRSGGTWGTPSAWTNSTTSLSGLACSYFADWNLLVCGQDGGGRRAWACVYGDGFEQPVGTWSSLLAIAVAAAGSSVEFKAPTLKALDVFRGAFVESYSGSGGYSRPFTTYLVPWASFQAELWREPAPFDLACSYGVALAGAGGGYAWLSAPSGVWRAPYPATSLALTDDVVRLTAEITPDRGGADVVLRNDDGRYNTPGMGTLRPLYPGAELTISPGYVTSGGAEWGAGHRFWVESIEHAAAGGRASLVVHAVDLWGLLRRWRARRQFAWAAGQRNIFQLLGFVLARVGFEYSTLSSSAMLAAHYPAYAIHPNESGGAALERLLAMVADSLLMRGARAYTKNPTADEASGYSYGSGHAVVRGRYIAPAHDANRSQVYGQGVLGEAFAWGQVGDSGDRLAQVHDLNLTTTDFAAERAAAELRRCALAAERGEIWVRPNCGHELWDVIDITDGRAGLSAAKRRVRGIHLDYAPAEGRYEQRLSLTEV